MFVNQVHIGQIYRCYFDSNRVGEFQKTHYALLIRKGFDRQTVTVVPLTSSNKGLGVSCCDIGIYPDLNANTDKVHSYAVYSHVQTISVTRLSLPNEKNITVDAATLQNVISNVVHYLTSKLDPALISKIGNELINSIQQTAG